MRGNPLIELIAILVMLAGVLVGGAYWGVYKYEHKVQKKEENVLQTRHRQSNMNSSFESLHKRTE